MARGFFIPRAHRVPILCLGLFIAVFCALGIAPVDRGTWALENVPTVVIVGLFVATYRRFRLSDRAYAQGLVFLILHSIGSHYTYTRMPFGLWLRDVLSMSRNPYDRIVHFSFGLLLLRSAEEVFVRGAGGRLRWFLAFCVIAWWSLAYELVEWLVAIIVAPEQGLAFLAMQGDIWDTQKDMAVACLGAALACVWEVARSRRRT